MTGHEYEYCVASYLRNHGYNGVAVTKASGDFGVDVIAHRNGRKYAVQCKYYEGSVGVSSVQEVVAGKAYYGCDAAMVVTNSTFTKAAEELARANGVVLLDGIASAGSGIKFSKLLKWAVILGYLFVGSAMLSVAYEKADSIFTAAFITLIVLLPFAAYVAYRVWKEKRKAAGKNATQTATPLTAVPKQSIEVDVEKIRGFVDVEEVAIKVSKLDRITTSSIQRTCGYGYMKAAELRDQLFKAALISPVDFEGKVYEWTENAKKPS